METAQFAILAGLSALSLAICAYLLLKVRTITYLLEQPVVKKMSPQLKLKPVKIDEIDGEARPNQARNATANGAAPARSPRPAFEGGERPPRDQNRDRGPRPERTEGGDRPPREGGFDRNGGDRAPRNDRGDRGDRFGGGRDRGERGGRGGHDRHERGDRPPREGMGGGRDGGDRNRNRSESFGNSEAAPAEGVTSRPAPVASESAPSHSAPALSPRRPLPSTVDHEVERKEIPAADSAAATAAAEDALFARDESDMQHGRRNQLKKKPRFEVADEEAKTTEETKA
ncbi:MAG: hypothetical protein JWO30_2663 [Fibrobacteres bacterium]|nr:hypothetical protein [Fibrobacterota bacterium]